MHLSIKNIAKTSIIYSLGQWATAFLGIILIPVYTRIFSTEDYGVIDLIGATTIFLVLVLQLGMDEAITRFFCDSDTEKEKGLVATTVLLFKLFTYIPILCVVILLSGRISVLLFGSAAYARLIAWSFASVFTTGLYVFLLNLLRLRFRVGLFAVMCLLQLLSQLFLTVYFVVWARTGIVGIYWAAVISMGTFTVILFALNGTYLRSRWSTPLLKAMFLFGIPTMPAAVAIVLMDYLDRYFVNYYWGLEELGVYGIGYKASMVLLMVTSGFNLAWAPLVYASYERSDSRRIMAQTLNYYNSIMTAVAVAIALFAVELLRVFTTEPYYGAAKVVGLVVFGLLIFQVTAYFSVGIAIAKKMHIRMWCCIVAVGANCLLNWLLIPRYGMEGAAWATLLSYSLFGVLMMIGSELCFHIPYAYTTNLALWLAGGAMVVVERLWLSQLYTIEGMIRAKAVLERLWLGQLPIYAVVIGAKVLLLALFFLLIFRLKLIPSYAVRASFNALTGRDNGPGH